MKLISYGSTNIGRKRKVNQDSFRMEAAQKLFVVADGMGGHAAGELASKITVDTIAESILEDKATMLHSVAPSDMVIAAIHRANSAVFATAEKDQKLAGMGTTVLALLFESNQLVVGHVGDSRVYLARRNELWQITRDHSLVNEKFKAGLITREQMKKDKNRNVITRSVGFESSVLVDVYQKEIQPGDIYLACSDGLSGLVNDAEILSILCEHAFDSESLEGAVNTLIDRANQNGGDDNITTVLVRVDKE